MNGDVLVCIQTALDSGLRAYDEFPFDFRFVIDQELNGMHIPVFRHLHGEFRISYRYDFPRQRLGIGRV
jgi:hypothetical protein